MKKYKIVFEYIKKKLFFNFKIKFLCLLLAIGLYISVGLFIKRNSKNYSVALRVENIKENLVVSNSIPKFVKVTVKDKPEVIDKISGDDFNVRLDLEDIHIPGKFKRKIKWDVPTGVRSLFSSIEIEPSELSVETDELMEKNVGIIINTVGMPSPGYVEKRTAVEPATVRIQGPRSILESIKSVKTEKISLESARESFSRQVSLVSDYETVKVLGKADVSIEIVEDVDTVRFYFNDAKYFNLKDSFKARINEQIEVIFKGAKNALKPFTKDDITLMIDCSSVTTAGEYLLDVNIKKPLELTTASIRPDKVKVIIERNR